jgi:HK97 family phage major capsid protein
VTLETLIAERDSALASSDQILSTIERAKRLPTATEQSNLNTNRITVERLTPQIDTLQKAGRASLDLSSVREQLRAMGVGTDTQPPFSVDSRGVLVERILPKTLSSAYFDAFKDLVRGEGKNPAIRATLQEGLSTSGGNAVPILVQQQAQTLSPTASEIEDGATVIVTDSDNWIPSTPPSGLPSAAIVSETNAFNQPVATLQQTKLSAFMIPSLFQVSMELAQDWTGLSTWLEQSVAASFSELLDTYYTGGTGSGQPQGLLGNIGAGVFAEPDEAGNIVSFAGLSAVIGAVKPGYRKNGTFLMNQATAMVVRAALAYAGAAWAWSRDNDGTERLFGYPVKYSISMPSASRGNTPVIFGDFRRGYVIGKRGGNALFLKVIQQLVGMTGVGTLQYLLYQRVDGRVWNSEALQPLQISAS